MSEERAPYVHEGRQVEPEIALRPGTQIVTTDIERFAVGWGDDGRKVWMVFADADGRMVAYSMTTDIAERFAKSFASSVSAARVGGG